VGRIGRVMLVVGALGFALTEPRGVGARSEEASRSRPVLPPSVFFERYDGQTNGQVLYRAHGRGYRLSLARRDAVLTLSGAPDAPVRLRFEGGNPQARVVGLEELPGKVYYSPPYSRGRLVGHPTFRSVRYENLYDGVDVLYYGSDERLEFDLEIAPGSDPSRISLVLDGASDLSLSPNGDLLFQAGSESVTLRRPVVYQERNGVRSEVEGSYVLANEARVGFALGDYDRGRPLVVDPVFSFDTAGDDIVRGVEVNAAGEVFLLGETTDSSGFAWDEVEPGSMTHQCYLAKMDPSSSTLLYTILFAGTDLCTTLALSPNGVAYFPGYENPVTPGLQATTLVSVDDRSGGPEVERAQINNYDPFGQQVGAIAADVYENIYLLGTCRVVSPGQPPLDLLGFNDAPDAGSGQPTCVMGSSQEHVLLTKVARDGTVEYATFLASDDNQDVAGAALAVDDEERVFVMRPRSAAVPVTPDAYRGACSDPACGYFMVIDTAVTGPESLRYATYLWQTGLAGSERQIVRLGAPDSVFVAWDGQIDLGFPETNFDPYPDVPRPVDPYTGVAVSEGIQLARFDFNAAGAPNLLRYARVAVGNVAPDGSEHLVDLRVLASGAAVVGVLLAPDPNATGLPFQSDFRAYYRSGVNAFVGNDVILQMYPNTAGDAPAFAFAMTPAGQRVTSEEFTPSASPGPWEIRVDVSSLDLDPGANTPPTITISPRQTTVETYDPDGTIVPGYLAAFDWDEDGGTAIGIGANCTYEYNITKFPLGTTHAVCTAMDDDGATTTEAYDVTVDPAVNTTAARTPVSLVDVSGPASNVHTPGQVTATFEGTVDGSGLTWLRTRVDQKPIGPLPGFQLGSSPFYYDVGTTAVTTGPIRLCFDLTGMSFAEPTGIRLYRLSGSQWSDVTDSVDFGAGQICTVAPDTAGLGTFALFTPADESSRVEILAGVGRAPGNDNNVGFVPAGDGGPATSAALSAPTAVAFDLPRNAMYIADGRQVRRIDLTSGIITRYAGLDPTAPSGNVFGNPVEGGLAVDTEFMQIDDVAVDREGNLFLAEAQSCVIQRIDRATGLVGNVAGSWLGDQSASCGNTGDGGAARSATISLSSRLAFDAQGNLFFLQSSGLPQQVFTGTAGFIRRIAAGADGLILGRPEETISTIAGSGQQVPVEGSPLASGMAPSALAFGHAGDLYVATHDKVVRILPAQPNASLTGDPAETLQIVAGGDPLAHLPFGGDQGHPLDADVLLVSDLEVLPEGQLLLAHWNTKRIRVIDPGADGAVDASADERIATLAGFEYQPPPGVLDLSDFNPEDYALSTLFFPSSATLDPRGGIVVADPLRHYVRRFGTSAPGLSLLTFSVDFAAQTVGTTSAPTTIVISNAAPDPIAIRTVEIDSDFTQDSSSCQTLAPGASCAIEIFFTPTTAGPVVGELRITDSALRVYRVALRGDGLPGSDADLSVAVAATPLTVDAGSDLSYRVEVTNHGPAAANGLWVRMPVLGGFSIASVDSPGGLCTFPIFGVLGSLDCSVNAPLASGAQYVLVVHLTPTVPGTLSSTFTVGSATTDDDSSNNVATVSVTVTPATDLSISSAPSRSLVTVGDSLSYAVTVENHGPLTATGIVFSMPAPVGFAIDQIALPPLSCTFLFPFGSVSCGLSDLPPGAQVTFAVNGHATAGPTATATFHVGAVENDPFPGNDSTTVGVFVNRPPSADAGPDRDAVVATSPAAIPLSVAVSDPDGDPILPPAWFEGAQQIATGLFTEASLTYGTHVVTVVVTDARGGQGHDDVTIRVLPAVLSAPAFVNAEPDAPGRVVVSWPAVPGAAEYRLFRDVDPVTTFQVLPAGNVLTGNAALVGTVTGTSFVDTGLPPLVRQFYAVVAANGAVVSSPTPASEAIVQADPNAPIFGFADTHNHQFANLGFGRSLIWGSAFSPAGLADALNRCELAHGPSGVLDVVESFLAGALTHDTLGFDPSSSSEFTGWPWFGTRTHQQAYYESVRRAFEGGQRLMVMHAESNELLCELTPHDSQFSCKDMASVDDQLQGAKNLEYYIDQQSGGPGKGWYRIAYSGAEARHIINSGRMAVVLGIEVDELFSCGKNATCTLDDVRDRLDHYHQIGVRHLFPVAHFDNGFGGAAMYNSLYSFGNYATTGSFFGVRSCGTEGYQYQSSSGAEVVAWNTLQQLLHPGSPAPTIPDPPFAADCNSRGLTDLGEFLVREMMARGMIIDIDHMSALTANGVLSIAEESGYPAIVSGHSGPLSAYRGQKSNEGGKTTSQLNRIHALGGLSAVLPQQGDRSTSGNPDGVAQVAGTVINDCGQSSRTFAQAYIATVDASGGPGAASVGIGTDFNGLGGQPGPRIGARACPGDSSPSPQANGIVYPFDIFAPAGVRAGRMSMSTMPPRKDNSAHDVPWDFNVDGLAHDGLVPDLIEDLRRVGVTDAYLQPLFRSAEAYVHMWERADGSTTPFQGGVLMPPGQDALYRAASPGGAPQPVVVQFASIDEEGYLVTQAMENPPPPPVGTVFLGPVFDLFTTAAFTPPVTVCIEGTVFDAGDSLVHFESGAWVDITVSTGSTSTILCGQSSSFSPFAVVRSVNQPPTASAGAYPPFEATSPAGAVVTLAGSGSDPDPGDTLAFIWTEGTVSLGSAAEVTTTFAIGAHEVTLTVSDSHAVASSTALIVVRDTTPPAVTPPSALTVPATTSTGTSVESWPALSAWLSSAIAVDAADAASRALTPRANGAPVDGTTIFPIGTTTVTFSFQDASGNTGSATSSVTVSVGTPRIRVRLVESGDLQNHDKFVDLSVTNEGTGVARRTAMIVTAWTTKGFGLALVRTPMPVTVGDLNPGESRLIRVRITVPTTSKELAMGEAGVFVNVNGVPGFFGDVQSYKP
jgi:uncharacterized repeat protein (TIGR01451 family)